MNRLVKISLKFFDICIKIIVIGVFVFPFLWMISMALQTQQEVNTFPTTFIPKTPQFQNMKEVDGLANRHIVMAGNMLLTLPVLVIYSFACRNIIKAFAYSGIK